MDVDVKVALATRRLKKDMVLENALREYPEIRDIFLDRIGKDLRTLEDLAPEYKDKHGFMLHPRMQVLEVNLAAILKQRQSFSKGENNNGDTKPGT